MSAPIIWKNVKRKLGQLKPWKENPRQISESQAGRLQDSFNSFAQVETFAISPDDEIYDGHQRYNVLLKKYGKDYVIDCRQSSRKLTEKERRKLVVYLHAGATGDWNWDSLSSWDVKEMKGWGFDSQLLKGWQTDASALKAMLASDEEEPADAEPEIDRAESLQKKYKTKTGQLWQLGNHRLLVGDSNIKENVDAVLGKDKPVMSFIDPPYNALKSWHKDEARGETRLDPSEWFDNDNMEWEDYWKFIETAFGNLQGHSVYVCCDYRIYDGFKPRIIEAGWDLKHCIVWKKNVWGLGKRYRFQHEFIIYACKKDAPFYGNRDESDVWEVDAVRGEGVDHKTPKPLGLPIKAIECSSAIDDIVYDSFSGSGTVLIACDNLKRECRAIEKDPKYAAVTIQRWVDVTGGKPALL